MYIKQIYFAVGFKEPSCRYFSPFLLCLLVICLASSLFLFLSFLILSNLFMFPQCFILWALLSFCFRLWWLGLIRQSVKICRRHSLKAYSHPFHLTNSTFVFPLYIARAQAIFGDTNTESICFPGLKIPILIHSKYCLHTSWVSHRELGLVTLASCITVYWPHVSASFDTCHSLTRVSWEWRGPRVLLSARVRRNMNTADDLIMSLEIRLSEMCTELLELFKYLNSKDWIVVFDSVHFQNPNIFGTQYLVQIFYWDF